jgi:hypothetical protein
MGQADPPDLPPTPWLAASRLSPSHGYGRTTYVTWCLQSSVPQNSVDLMHMLTWCCESIDPSLQVCLRDCARDGGITQSLPARCRQYIHEFAKGLARFPRISPTDSSLILCFSTAIAKEAVWESRKIIARSGSAKAVV